MDKKKKKVLDTDKNGFIKINIESCPQEIWIRIRFLEINRFTSQSKIYLVLSVYNVSAVSAIQRIRLILLSVCLYISREKGITTLRIYK